MTQWERRLFNGLHAVVAATGVVYFYMKYLLPVHDPFAVINHPWQPFMLAAHVVAAPIFVLVFGMVLRSHILKKLLSNSRPARRSGWLSLTSFAGMALSGYLLQVAADPFWVRVMLVTHVSTSLLFLVGYSAHLVVGWRILRAPPAAGPAAGLDRVAGLSS